jgi:hypothetical protein
MHVNVDNPLRSNDYYALDMDILGYPNDGVGEPIVSIASGTVLLAGWGTKGWASYGIRVVIEHDYVDDGGHRYYSLYAHLASENVTPGQHVEAGQQIGTLGGSSYGDLQGTGYHLHFALYQDGNIGGSGTGSHYGGRAVVPEPLGGAENIVANSTMNGSVPGCEEPTTDPQPDAGIPGPTGGLPDAGPYEPGADPPAFGSDAGIGPGPSSSSQLYSTGLCSASGGSGLGLLGLLLVSLVLASRSRVEHRG